jgi:hypothetical protein
VEVLSSRVLAKLAIVVAEPMIAHRGATFMVERNPHHGRWRDAA